MRGLRLRGLRLRFGRVERAEDPFEHSRLQRRLFQFLDHCAADRLELLDRAPARGAKRQWVATRSDTGSS